MAYLPTACSLLLFLLTAFLAWRTHLDAGDARDEADELRKVRMSLTPRVHAMQLSVDNLFQQIKKVNGKVGQLQMGRRPVDDDDEEPRIVPAPRSYDDIDPELAAELALQNAPAASPGKS